MAGAAGQPAGHAHNVDLGLTSGMNDWKSFKPGAPLVEPEVRRSVDGVLETTLRHVSAYLDVGGYRLFMRTYEGMSPGPTFQVKPGDIHTNDMLVTKVNGKALPEPIWMETAIVSRWGSLTFSRFEDFTGIFMLHCHMMNHEELGMMQAVEVYSDAAKNRTDSGVVLPIRFGWGVLCGS